MEYEVIRTDTADAGIRKIILYIAQNFGNEVALEQLDYIEALTRAATAASSASWHRARLQK